MGQISIALVMSLYNLLQVRLRRPHIVIWLLLAALGMPEAWTQQSSTRRLSSRNRITSSQSSSSTSRSVRLSIRSGRTAGIQAYRTWVYIVISDGAYAYHTNRKCQTINRRNIGTVMRLRLSVVNSKTKRTPCKVCTK